MDTWGKEKVGRSFQTSLEKKRKKLG